MFDPKEECRQHFNDIMLSFGEICRCIGFGVDDMDYYIIVRMRDGSIKWNTMVGGWHWMDALRGSGIVKPKHPKFDGEIWSDYTRLELECKDIPKEAEFMVIEE